MHKLFFLSVLVLAFALASVPAMALSTEHDSTQSGDGTAKFSDPDEQRPAIMNGATESEDGTPSKTGPHFSVTSGNGATPFGVTRDQPDAFDQAFQHK